ncbi:MAG: alginate lyase family protein [Bacteroidetes Order II. Incertae sedis bacterium]|nr:alginate lyase family protein [Bacteroidetes Order II. bacterium]
MYYALYTKLGILARKTKRTAWDWEALSQLTQTPNQASVAYWAKFQERKPKFLFDPKDRAKYAPFLHALDQEAENPQALREEVQAFLEGKLRFFDGAYQPIGFPPRWNFNCIDEIEIPNDVHWSRLSDFAFGDIKLVWEMSRFKMVYKLVRLYWRTGDASYAEVFWQLIEDWVLHNPPNLGPNWKCGQETSLRAFAWTFGLYGFADCPASTPERIRRLVFMIGVSAERVEANLAYAISQRNNHGINEAFGLWFIGLLFPEFKSAPRWFQKGQKWLEYEAQELIAPDGSFVMHGHNYHRIILTTYLITVQLATLNKLAFSQTYETRLKTSFNFLARFVIGEKGEVPNYGYNDGSLNMPLSTQNFHDFRPILQAGLIWANQHKAFKLSSGNEDSIWLLGLNALNSPYQPIDSQPLFASPSDYFILQDEASTVFTRNAIYTKDRPAHADALHIDLWWKGINLAIDPGTFSYNGKGKEHLAFEESRFHNVVTVNGANQMIRFSRFLWLPWVKGQNKVETKTKRPIFYGKHDGYEVRFNTYYERQIISLGQDKWVILDWLEAQKPEQYTLHWLWGNFPVKQEGDQLIYETSKGNFYGKVLSNHPSLRIDLTKGTPLSAEGQFAPNYYALKATTALKASVQAQSCLFVTVFAPQPCSVTLKDHVLTVNDQIMTISKQL